MNFKQLTQRKRFLENMLRVAEGLPESYAHRAELVGTILRAITLEKRGLHNQVDALIPDFTRLVKSCQEKLDAT